MSLVVPPIDSAEPNREAAKSLLGTFQAVAGTADAISTTWSGLASVYSSPEESIVHSAMNKPDNYARTVQGHADTMYAALDAYATRLEELQKVREQLVKDIADHEARVEEASNDTREKVIARDKHGLPVKMKDNAVDPALVDEGEALHGRVTQFVTDLEDAQRECGNKLNATWGGAQFVQADKTHVDNPNVYGTSNDSKRDQARTGQAPWGSPDVWRLANMEASGNLVRGGVWNSITGSFKDFMDLTGFGGDPGATENKRSGLGKLVGQAWDFFGSLTPGGALVYAVSPEARERYDKAAEAMGEVAKNMVSWDTWGTDPHGTFGSMLPDVAGLATGAGASKLGFKILGKLSPNLALRIAELRQLLRLRNIGNWNHDLRDWFQKFGQMSPGSGAAVELERLRGVVADGAHGGKSPDGSDATPTVPRQGAGPIEAGARSGDGAGSGGAGSRGGVRDGSGHGGDGHPRGVEGHGGVRDRDAESRVPRRGDVDHPTVSEESAAARRGGEEYRSPRRADVDHPGGNEELPRENVDAAPGRGVSADGESHTPGDGSSSGEAGGRSGGGESDSDSLDSLSQEKLEQPRAGTRVTPGTTGRPYDPDAPVRETIPAKQWEKESGYKYTQEDVQRTLDNGPRNGDGQPVDHRNGRPLRLVQGDSDRGWVMRYDREAGTWLPENRGLNEGGMPARGEPNSYGYDENGDLLPYANERPQYTKEQIEKVWTNSRNEQLKQIRNGKLDLPEPGADQMWVRALDDAADGPDMHVDADGGKWRKVEWRPGEPRDGLWDMGHISKAKYSKLRDQYLSGEIDTKEFLRRYRDSGNYRVEDPMRNRSHIDE
ncbi:MAG: HNH/ENDO VII family nuclease [Propionibacterium sp.]|nr:HNH/ENDO VII family nuclease [Propionibacterium sp.]